MYYYKVAPLTVIRSTEVAFTYQSETSLQVGLVVRVPIGKKEVTGVILAVVEKPKFATKPVSAIITILPLPPPLLALCQWLSEYYATHLAITLQTLLPAGLHKQRRISESTTTHPTRARTNIVLNSEQASALRIINEHKTGTLLLHGVTGSGKTQIYIEAARQQLALQRSTIVLVPEIALTSQLVAEFKNHFEDVIVTHSGMTEAERHKIWLQILEATKPLIIIGPRSALFMPLKQLGLIVVDEAHEPSYKQDQSPRYSALRAASMLSRFHAEAKVILGSATPSVADYYLAKKTKSPILRLTSPALATQPPTIELVDLRNRDFFREHRFLSDALIAATRQALHKKQQVLLFHNRRGTAPTTLCSECGWSPVCSFCFIPMTLHADQHKLLCHICGRSQKIPPSCPSCSSPSIIFKGFGTKLIEDAVRKLFPKATVARFDADNSATNTIEKRYQEIYDGGIDILIGTQAIAKGLDIPNLSVVGVVQADTGLHLPDYQAKERVFQLLYQSSGRVGRGRHESQVIVQTYLPDHPIIKLALNRDYSAFYQQQLQERQAALFPPFRYLLKVTTSYKTELGAVRAAQKLAQNLKVTHPTLTVLGPTPAFYERLHGNYRWQLIIKSTRRADLVAIAQTMGPNWQADLDPVNLL